MSTNTLPLSYSLYPADRRVGKSDAVLQMILFCLGCVLPLISFRTELGPASANFTSRIAIVDLFVCCGLIALLPAHRLIIHRAIVVYGLMLIWGLSIGMMRSTPEDADYVPVYFAALSMALLYAILGYNVGRSATLTRAVILGIAISVYWQSIIVIHDFLSSDQWFVDQITGRARGTFRDTGQLGAYGFGTAGLLLTFGWKLFRSRSMRNLVIVAGLLSMFFVWAASRRTSLISLGLWSALILLISLRHFGKYLLFIPFLIILIMGLVVLGIATDPANSYTGQRMGEAVQHVLSGQSFPQRQLDSTIQHADEWFPLGLGMGRGMTVDFEQANELHNAHLVLLVEMGIFGLLAFYWVLAQPFLRSWEDAFGAHTILIKHLTLSFILVALFMMLHQTLHRDRGFLLFIGLISTLSLASDESSTPTNIEKRNGSPTSGAAGGTK